MCEYVHGHTPLWSSCAAKVTGRNTMMRTMTQRNIQKLREGKTGQRYHGDDLLSATASHSSRVIGFEMKEGGNQRKDRW